MEGGSVLVSWDDGDPTFRRISARRSHIRGCRLPAQKFDLHATSQETPDNSRDQTKPSPASPAPPRLDNKAFFESTAWTRLRNVVMAKVRTRAWVRACVVYGSVYEIHSVRACARFIVGAEHGPRNANPKAIQSTVSACRASLVFVQHTVRDVDASCPPTQCTSRRIPSRHITSHHIGSHHRDHSDR